MAMNHDVTNYFIIITIGPDILVVVCFWRVLGVFVFVFIYVFIFYFCSTNNENNEFIAMLVSEILCLTASLHFCHILLHTYIHILSLSPPPPPTDESKIFANGNTSFICC